MTKSFYHEEICAQSNSDFVNHILSERRDSATGEETLAEASEIFSDRRISHDGYEEFDCDLCGKPNTAGETHSECHDREQAWSDAQSEREWNDAE